MKNAQNRIVSAQVEGHFSRGVRSVRVDDAGRLLFTMTDGSVLDLGVMPQPSPGYIEQEVDRVAALVQKHRSPGSLVLAAMSDLHLMEGSSLAVHANTRAAAELAGQGLEALRKRLRLDGAVFLGDYSWGDADYTAQAVKEDLALATRSLYAGTLGLPALWLRGNHDLNYGANRDRLLTEEELYSHIAAASTGIRWNEDNPEKGYGLLDFPEQRIRLILLNTCDTLTEWTAASGASARSEWIGHAQLQWLADTALRFADKEDPTQWGVVLLSHHPLNYPYNTFNMALRLLEAYQAGTAGALNYTVDGTAYTVTYDFTAGGKAEIWCSIHGHSHNYSVDTISSGNVEPWLPRLCVPNLCFSRNNEAATSENQTFRELFGEFDGNGAPIYYPKTENSAQGTAFTVLNIDRKTRTVYATAFGAGPDRAVPFAGTPQATEYINQIPISTDADGSIYNGVGFKTDTYLSAGNVGTRAGYVTTGFIPIPEAPTSALGQCVLYFKNLAPDLTDSSNRMALYTLDKTHVATKDLTNTTDTEPVDTALIYRTVDSTGALASLDLSVFNYYLARDDASKMPRYIRLGFEGIDENTVCTVNQPIA